MRYRTWLINEIYSQLRVLKPDASFTDAKLFLYMIEGAIIQRLSSDEVDERMVEVFLRGWGEVEIMKFKLEIKKIFLFFDKILLLNFKKHLRVL